MSRRFYIKFKGECWSLSKQCYSLFLNDGVTTPIPLVNASKYQARLLKRIPKSAQPIDVTDFDVEHYREELEHFLKTNSQTGFSAADYINVFFD